MYIPIQPGNYFEGVIFVLLAVGSGFWAYKEVTDGKKHKGTIWLFVGVAFLAYLAWECFS